VITDRVGLFPRAAEAWRRRERLPEHAAEGLASCLESRHTPEAAEVRAIVLLSATFE